VKPTVLIGTTGKANTFPEPVLREMARHVERPLVLPMSNPTSSCEALPADVLAWTDGRALVATGSPFGPVKHGGRLITVGQVNNAMVFPGVGLGAIISEARVVTDSMFAVAADQLASEVDAEDLAGGSVFPPVRDIRRITANIAAAVVREAGQAGVARQPVEESRVAETVAAAMWEPIYAPMVPTPL
jgi:malate dehydrogenase (oxaloacetate-decarboxylating)